MISGLKFVALGIQCYIIRAWEVVGGKNISKVECDG